MKTRHLGRSILTIAATLMLALVAPIQAIQEQEFKPATNLGEQLPAAPLVFIAYAFCWVALLAYVFLLWRRIGRVHNELAMVNAKLGSRKA